MAKRSRLEHELKQRIPFREPAEEAAVAILRTADFVRRTVARLAQAQGITEQQYNVLRILRGSHPGGLPVGEIADRMIERQPGASRLVDRLEEKGLVRRERSTEDRRVVDTRITEAGLALLAAMDEPTLEADRWMTSRLTEAEKDRLIALLEKVRAAEDSG